MINDDLRDEIGNYWPAFLDVFADLYERGSFLTKMLSVHDSFQKERFSKSLLCKRTLGNDEETEKILKKKKHNETKHNPDIGKSSKHKASKYF